MTETNARGSPHFYVNVWANITAAILQGSVDVQRVCDTISDILESMYCTELPRRCHVEDLTVKELSFFPNKSKDFSRKIHRGRAMLMPPDPVKNKVEFDDHVNQTVLYCGMHSHDKSVKELTTKVLEVLEVAD